MIRFALRHTKITSLICVALLLVFIILIIWSLTGGSLSHLITISIFGIMSIFIFRALVLSTRKKEQQKKYNKQREEIKKQAGEIVQCANCGNEMTYGYFQEYGCQKCHTDLFIKTGKYAK